jgi:hypothetical protein
MARRSLCLLLLIVSFRGLIGTGAGRNSQLGSSQFVFAKMLPERWASPGSLATAFAANSRVLLTLRELSVLRQRSVSVRALRQALWARGRPSHVIRLALSPQRASPPVLRHSRRHVSNRFRTLALRFPRELVAFCRCLTRWHLQSFILWLSEQSAVTSLGRSTVYSRIRQLVTRTEGGAFTPAHFVAY